MVKTHRQFTMSTLNKCNFVACMLLTVFTKKGRINIWINQKTLKIECKNCFENMQNFLRHAKKIWRRRESNLRPSKNKFFIYNLLRCHSATQLTFLYVIAIVIHGQDFSLFWISLKSVLTSNVLLCDFPTLGS